MRYEDEPVALTDGRWVNVRGVMRWQKDPETIAAPEPACTKCGALPWEPCVTKSGKRMEGHRARKSRQVCRCGGALTPGSNLCAACRGREVPHAA